MINLSALKNRVEVIPYDTYIVTDLLNSECQQEMSTHYPTNHFKEFTLQKGNESVDENFQFKFEFFSLEHNHLLYLQKMGFNPQWTDFINFITSSKYRECLSDIVNLNLNNTNYKIEFTRYKEGDFLDAHYDKQSKKILTQLFYFNTYWKTSWGGYFHILNPHDIDQTVIAIPPLTNYSVLIKSSINAWHKVSQIHPKAEQARVNMVLEFYME